MCVSRRWVKQYGWLDPDFLETLFPVTMDFVEYVLARAPRVRALLSRRLPQLSHGVHDVVAVVVAADGCDGRAKHEHTDGVHYHEPGGTPSMSHGGGGSAEGLAQVIAINQDTLVTAGDLVANTTTGGQIWYRDLANGDKAVVLLNPQDTASIWVDVTWEALGWPADTQASIRDLWARVPVPGCATGHYNHTNIAPHDVFYFRASPSC